MPLVQAKKQGVEVFPPRPSDLEKKCQKIGCRGVSTSAVGSGKKNVWDLGAEVMPPQPTIFYPVSEPSSEAELTITKIPLVQAKKQGAEVFPPRPSNLEKKWCRGVSTLAVESGKKNVRDLGAEVMPPQPTIFYPVSEPGSEAELTITKMPLV
ncbi:Hypothetical predicted protein [Olea europaea subsp. europaea]|uniref:Uncharacterized protein n=1 Tax=Olea europaea subsp. europaea TaxID=158383 RepID=A0A8S0RL92_OLEEU|nr:Hypothetical predicted protein [Olea europaea subsp. europaea]